MAKKPKRSRRSSGSGSDAPTTGQHRKTVTSKLGNRVTRAANGTKIIHATTGATIFKKVTKTDSGTKVEKYRYDATKGKKR
jgi:hypothetical protein